MQAFVAVSKLGKQRRNGNIQILLQMRDIRKGADMRFAWFHAKCEKRTETYSKREGRRATGCTYTGTTTDRCNPIDCPLWKKDNGSKS